MEPGELVVGAAGGAARVGSVVAVGAHKGRATVRWDDGVEESVLTKSLRVVPADSVLVGWLRDPQALAKQLADDPAAVIVAYIKDAGRVLSRTIKKQLNHAGIDQSAVNKAWDKAKATVKAHPNVAVMGEQHQWSDTPVARAEPETPTDPIGALEGMLRSNLKAAQRRALAEVVRAGLTAGSAEDRDVAFRAAQERQWRIDVVRAVAELAIRVEEEAYNTGDPEVIVERVRTQTLARSLRPIGQPGEETVFDPAQHRSLAGVLQAGTPVYVIRPGYSWHPGQEDVLIERAVVASM